jgi:integrase
MPRLTEKITDRLVRDLSAPAKGNTLHYDPELPGFAARVTAKGARAFVLVYHFGGVERRDTIGEFPAWRAKAARDVAEGWRRDIRSKIDPRGEPEPEAAPLFKALAEEFLEHGRRKRGLPLRPATKREYRRALMVCAAPLHGRPLAEVRRGEAASLIRDMASARGEVTAMRTRAALSRLYTWAIANGHAELNPVAGTEGYSTPKRSLVLSDAELRAIWGATAEPGDFNLIVRLCVWTGCRRAEAGGMAWAELADGVWTVPGERTKNHRPLALPLPRQALQVLEGWHRIVGRNLVFGRGPAGFQAWSQSKRRLDARLDLARDFDLHDIRRTVETRMAGLGIPKDHVNRVLNHAMAPVAQHYDHHDYADEKAAALQRWADALERIVGEAQPNVVPIRSAS